MTSSSSSLGAAAAVGGGVGHHPLESRSNWICFWLLGTINNYGYVVVLSAAQSIAASYGASAYIGAINWADVGLGLVAKGVNAFALEKVPTSTRVWVATFLMALGIIGCVQQRARLWLLTCVVSCSRHLQPLLSHFVPVCAARDIADWYSQRLR
jgi:CLN3 protein